MPCLGLSVTTSNLFTRLALETLGDNTIWWPERGCRGRNMENGTHQQRV